MPLPTAIEIVARLEAIRLRLGRLPESLREVQVWLRVYPDGEWTLLMSCSDSDVDDPEAVAEVPTVINFKDDPDMLRYTAEYLLDHVVRQLAEESGATTGSLA